MGCRLGFEDHRRVELFIGTHEGGVDILINEVMCAQFGYVNLAIDLLLYGLELHVGEVCFHLEVEGGVLVNDQRPDAVLLPTFSIGNKKELREKVLLSLGRHYDRGQAGIRRAYVLALHLGR